MALARFVLRAVSTLKTPGSKVAKPALGGWLHRCMSEKPLGSGPPLPTQNPSKSPYKHGAHRSDAEELVAKYPVIEVDGTVALCDGGGGALGHPIEFIQVANVLGEISICKYCGLRYKSKHKH